jgi:hypothetical protein
MPEKLKVDATQGATNVCSTTSRLAELKSKAQFDMKGYSDAMKANADELFTLGNFQTGIAA